MLFKRIYFKGRLECSEAKSELFIQPPFYSRDRDARDSDVLDSKSYPLYTRAMYRMANSRVIAIVIALGAAAALGIIGQFRRSPPPNTI